MQTLQQNWPLVGNARPIIIPPALDDAWQTMAVVEAAYLSSASPATPIPGLPAVAGLPE